MDDVDLPVDPGSPGRARRLVQSALGTRWGELGPDAAIAVSELVTNAVRHSRSSVRLHIQQDGRTLRVEVTDDGSGSPSLRPPSSTAGAGRGLLLVDRLVDRWGVIRHRHGKTVWFEMTLRGDSRGPNPSG
jgi:anti-sigma regulatory factor (Ser/Thr protein kinase)